MTTHELARAMETLASLLKALPDRELGITPNKRNGGAIRSVQAAKKPPAVPRLETLDKRELEKFIVTNKLSVPFRKKDSTNELMRRVSRYLDQNSAVKKQLRNRVVHTSSQTSPKLMQALTYLLRDKYE